MKGIMEINEIIRQNWSEWQNILKDSDGQQESGWWLSNVETPSWKRGEIIPNRDRKQIYRFWNHQQHDGPGFLHIKVGNLTVLLSYLIVWANVCITCTSSWRSGLQKGHLSKSWLPNAIKGLEAHGATVKTCVLLWSSNWGLAPQFPYQSTPFLGWYRSRP